MCGLSGGEWFHEYRAPLISLLDADHDQLPHRLRQMVALLKEQPIDFDALLTGLLYWDDDQKRTQNTWARDFYRTLSHETAGDYQNRKGDQ
jgi:CRISPR system Cascade subunit CasB